MVELTPRAVDKIREFSTNTPEAEGKDLRIYIQGMGCSGYVYGLTFDTQRDDDEKYDTGGVTVLVDGRSAPHLDGAKVDFVDDERGSGFVVDNPNAPVADACDSSGCCGCG